MKFYIKDFFSKCGQTCNFLWIRSHSLKKSIVENFTFVQREKTVFDAHYPLTNFQIERYYQNEPILDNVYSHIIYRNYGI